MLAGRSSGAARSFCLQEAKAKRGGGWIAWPVENPSGPGGAAGAHSAHKAWAGALGPRPCFGFAGLGPYGPQARKTPPPPRRNPGCLPLPRGSAAPAALRRLPGGEERTGRSPGAAAFGRPGAALWAAPGPPNKRAGPGPMAPGPALSGRFAPSRRPPGAGFCAPAPLEPGQWSPRRRGG